MSLNKKTVIKTTIILALFECVYLFAVPAVLTGILERDDFKRYINDKSPVGIEYVKPAIKTHIVPAVTFKAANIILKKKETDETIVESENFSFKTALIPLITKKITIQELGAKSINIKHKVDKNGLSNISKIIDSPVDSSYKISISDTKIKVSDVFVELKDETGSVFADLVADSVYVKPEKKKIIIKTKGTFNNAEFEADIKTSRSFNIKNIGNFKPEGGIYIYNLDLKDLLPFIKTFADENVSLAKGKVDYCQISGKKTDSKTREITVNTEFNNVVFDKTHWKNGIKAEGKNNVSATMRLVNSVLEINSFSYKADKINITAGGRIDLKGETPELDGELDVTDSRCENIAAILPPTLVPKLMTIEKVKSYGVFGDINGKVKFKGKIPHPDITGFVTGKNIHILDKAFHKTHTGTVNLNFDKRKLEMDILIDMPQKQKAFVKGYVYMYRDGINNVTVQTTPEIDFPVAQKLVLPISKVFNFQLGPVPDMNITSGKGIVDINVQGSPDYIAINGLTRFRNGKLTYNGLFGEINNVKGIIKFKNDVITVSSEKAFVKNNPINIKGTVKINDNLDFDITADNAEGNDILETVNKSSLLKDVKQGLAVISKASGKTNLFVNIKSKITPVPYGSPPLPFEEAFYDMKVKGYVDLTDDICYLEGFKIPFEKVSGRVDFTEEVVDLNEITAESGTSPLNITGKIITDIDTKIPDVDIIVTSNSVNLKDTVKFLTESYLYPKNYPDISPLYEIASKHDLYFKYKAKAIDFITDKAYAVMNFITDSTDSPLKAESGRIVLDKSTVKIENINALLFDSRIKINGNVKNIDKPIPLYNIDAVSDIFDIKNLNDADRLEILPDKTKTFLALFKNYSGSAEIKTGLKNNLLTGEIYFKDFYSEFKKNDLPIKAGDFYIKFNDNGIYTENFAGQIADMPFYGELSISDYYNKTNIAGYFTSKPTDGIIKSVFNKNISDEISLTGDINLSADIKGNKDILIIRPKLVLDKEADIKFANADLGDTADKREFTGNITVTPEKIKAENVEYTKYVASQHNKIYPILFAKSSVILNRDKNNQLIPVKAEIKTERNLSAKLLNIFLKTPLFSQGSISGDIGYIRENDEIASLRGEIDCKNLDIPLFDTVIKDIRLRAQDEIEVNLFGFLSDSRIFLNSIISNKLGKNPDIKSLNIKADSIDNDKLLMSMAKVHKAMTTNNDIKNIDFGGFRLNKGHIDIDRLTVKSMIATEVKGDFSIDENGIFSAENIDLNVEEGSLTGKMTYNLNTTETDLNFELINADANYLAETLFEAKNQIYGNADGQLILRTKGVDAEEKMKNLSGFVYFNINDGRMPRLGSLEYLLRASNIIKSGITGFTINNVLELLNLVKSGYFSNINGSCTIDNGIADNVEIFSTGDNLSMYIHGQYDISGSDADLEILGKLSKNISTVFGAVGNTSLNTLFKLIPGISLLDFGRKDLIDDVEKIPPFTHGNFDSRVFQAIVKGDINDTSSVKSFKWVKK